MNQEAARRYWPGINPIGQQLHLGVSLAEARSGMKTIVGVVGDVRGRSLDATAAPEVYVPHAQHPVDSLTHDGQDRRRPDAHSFLSRALIWRRWTASCRSPACGRWTK